MRHGLVHDRRLIAALVVVAALASPWAASARADVAQVTVVAPGGAAQTLALGALAGSEDASGSYLLRSASGESAQTLSGFSLTRILDAAGADPYGFSYLEIQRPAGGAVLLSRSQALDPGAFPDGPPLVYATAAGTGFLRPSAGPEDLNASDSFEAPQGIALVLRKGARLRIRAEASTLRTRPGKPVHFSAVVEQAGSGEQLTYSWYFDDGASAASADATHSFAKRGSYDVVLGVTSAGDDTGASAVVTIQVGAPITGPDRRGGGTDEDAKAPDHGAADGTSGLGGRTERARKPGPAENVKDDPIEGELVSAEASLQPPPPAKQAAARSGQLQNDGGGGIPGAAWGLLATLGLLGAGALIETRSLLG